ncbi:hypothetical protein, partial [Rhodosalinus sp. FB01]|uniref:hypothetical protein n=1 Tax=Rhodosalinus sp. FB01 TaxID=3239194 RepID=UPI003523CDBF
MNGQNEQLTPPKGLEHESSPRHIWKTVLGRAVFGFYAEVNNNPYFVNDQYIENLCEIENEITARYGRTTIYSLIFSIFAIATANDALGEASYFGFSIASIP